MNILPKKRWHVRTKDNIARVRRDEAKAAEEEKERIRKIELAEQEARINVLRSQRRELTGCEIPSIDGATSTPGNTVVACQDTQVATGVEDPTPAAKMLLNLFPEVEEGQKSWGTNKEHDEEKKQEQEKYEKDMGILTYLGQSASETEKCWWEKPADRHKAQAEEEEQATKSKELLDPLKDVRRYLACFKSKDTPSTSKISSKNTAKPVATIMPSADKLSHRSRERNSKKRKHKSKKSKKRRKSRHRSSSSESEPDTAEEKKRKLEALRTERLQREKEERRKTGLLLAKLRGEDVSEDKNVKAPVAPPAYQRKYHSQFNPEIARQNR